MAHLDYGIYVVVMEVKYLEEEKNTHTRASTYSKYGLQFIFVNFPVAVLVKEFEVPLQFLVNLPLQHQADGSDVLHKVYVTILDKEIYSRR